ncbi:MAG: M14 family metallopeptidase [Spirosomaceae bacterium]|nr:M14 family metallopeptidase [Spirosomataceae bacterium]
MKKLFPLLLVVLWACTFTSWAQVPTPKEHFGFNVGDDYMLATFTQTEAYFKKLAATSDRVKMVNIGKTEEGRDQPMLIITSPDNHKKLARYQEISQKLAHAEGLTDAQARELANEGKAVVWIDGGIHSTETVAWMQLIETAYQLTSRNDAENMRILNNTVILMVHINPDGQELTANWYMRNPTPEKRALEYLPRLYQKYAGHDNNRDFFMLQLKETQNVARPLFVDWIPQIMYNHHQRGPAGSIVAGPPYRDPFNYVFDPMVITGIDAVGAAMINRLNAEAKPGFTRLGGSVFSTWYNGGLRTTTYFHNQIGLLTEIIGGPTPETVPTIPSRLIPNNNTPFPVTPQKWHFKQSIDYSVSCNYAVLDYAARQSDQVLFNMYKMGKNSIERGSKDYWTLSPKRADAITAAQRSDRSAKPDSAAAPDPFGARGAGINTKYFDAVMKDAKLRDPRGYVVPANQQDFGTAVNFINALLRTGVLIHKATTDFSVNGKNYPAGSFVVKTNQAFRPHVLDLFEPQDHPNDFAYPGGPPVRPYDAAGWTLAYQMGVQFDRFLEDFNGPFERIPYGQLQTATGKTEAGAGGYVLSAVANNSYVAVNDLLAAGVEVSRLPQGAEGAEAGAFYVPAKAKAAVEKAAKEWGVVVKGLTKKPTNMQKVKPLRIALWDNYGGSMPSGWTRLLFDQYKFPYKVVHAQELDKGDLRANYDVIVFVRQAISAPSGAVVASEFGYGGGGGPKADDIPEEFRPWLGRVSADKTIPQLKKFLQDGGRIVTVGSSANLAYHLGLPVRNALVEMTAAGTERPLPNDKYYIPGSLLQTSLDSTQAATWGMSNSTTVYFDASPVFKLSAAAVAKGDIKPLMWFSTDKPLRSGWAWGQSYLRDGVAAFEAPVGAGKLTVFGPEITFRAQSQGTFKLLFNQLYGN